MKLTVAVFLSLCALALSASSGFNFNYPNKFPYKFEKNTHTYQKQILPLFYHVNQPSFYKEHIEIANSYHFNNNIQGYTKPEAVEYFYQIYKYHNFLNKGEIFSIFYEEHLEQAVALFKLFYYAHDFETFYKTAVWAKFNVNEGLYLYSLSVAVVHRPDLYGVVLPPIYEIYPYYFFNTEVIQEAYKYKQWYKGVPAEYYNSHKVSGVDGYVIYSNYSGYYANVHPEQSMSYFLEDIGINSYYYYYNIYYPYWMSGKEYQWKEYFYRGEQYYYFHQQLLARYYLERLSNGFGQIEHFDWEVPVDTYYYPSLKYPNGYEFPSRPKFAHLYEYFYNYGQQYSWKNKYAYSYTFVQQYEDRILDAIDKGYAYTYDGQHVALYEKDHFYSHKGFNYLGNLIEGNYDSPFYKYYGPQQVYARHLLGYSFQPYDFHKVAPSALEHFETSLRDPIFYQYYKKVTHYFQYYKNYLPYYTEKDLYWDGVSVDKVEFDRLITYFDDYYSDISNAVYVTPEEYDQHNFHIYVHQNRLNHKPFNYKVYVKSDKSTKAVVKIFLGPKYDEYYRAINISEHNYDFVEFDHFVYELKAGENVITRSSHDSYFYGYDYTSYYELYKQVMGASGDFTYDWKKSYFHFPQRFMLPKGTYDGFPYQFFVYVYPYTEYEGYGQQRGDQYHPYVGSGSPYFFVDKYPLGYPFDRTIKYEWLWYNMPNGYFYETKIYHKHFNDVNVQH